MLQYSLEVGICWAILYLIYIAFLRRETFFSINRWYLLSSLALGLLIPVLRTIPIAFQEEVVVVNEALYFISAGPQLIAANITAPSETESILSLNNLLLLVYSLGVLLVGSRFLIGLLKIKKLHASGLKTDKGSFTLVETAKFHLPFSFLNCVYFSKEMPINDNIEKILKHELTHVESWHTLDVLFTEVLQVLFWFNPLIILYKKAIKESHEYVADASVLQDTSQKIYGQILLRQSQSGLQIALANHFFHSHIKKRLTMMKQKKSKRPAMIKYLFALPVILLLMILFQSQAMPENTEFTPNLIPVETTALLKRIDDHKFVKNSGIDLEVEDGTLVYASASGWLSTICTTEDNKYTITLDHDITYSTHYGNLAEVFANHGKIEKGQVIARVASATNGSKSKLHFEIIKYGDWEDPKKYIVHELVIDNEVLDTLPQVIYLNGPASATSNLPLACPSLDFIWSQIEDGQLELFIDNKLENKAKAISLKEELSLSRVVLDDDSSIHHVEFLTAPPAPPAPPIFDVQGPPAPPMPPSLEVVWQQIGENDKIKVYIDSKREDTKKAISLRSNLSLEMVGMEDEDSSKIDHVEFVTKVHKYTSDEIYKEVDRYPRFPGCEDKSGTDKAKMNCSKKKMLEFIYTNVRYPSEARKSGIHGTSVIKFVVEPDGSITPLEVVRDIGGGTKEAVEEVVQKMVEMNAKWTPGLKNGKAVRVLYHLPVRFRLEGHEEVDEIYGYESFGRYGYQINTEPIDVVAHKSDLKPSDEIFKVVQEMPRFPGCEELEGTSKEKEDCGKNKMLEFIYTNLKYPKAARVDGIEGANVVQFVIEKDGSLTEMNLVRNIGGKTGEATMQVMAKMQADHVWTPGYQNGKAVRVLYTLPVRFKLEDTDSKCCENEEIQKALSANDEKRPYFIIDGKELGTGTTDIDAKEIKNVKVLKGKEATKAYGEKAKYGVVFVTTKDGKFDVREVKIESPKSTQTVAGEVLRFVEEMPRFPGCEDMDGTAQEKEECSKKELLKFIYSNLNYPNEARELGLEGTTVVQFVIDKNGHIKDAKVVRDIQGAFEEELQDLLAKMAAQTKSWTPGKQNGEAVNVLYTLPVKYLLEGLENTKESKGSEEIRNEKVNDHNNLGMLVTALRPNKILNISATSTLSSIEFTYDTDEAGPANISVYNTSGQLITKKSREVTIGKNIERIAINNGVAGMYIITLIQGESKITKKIFLN